MLIKRIETIKSCLIQYFEADFQWKVSLKILKNFHPCKFQIPGGWIICRIVIAYRQYFLAIVSSCINESIENLEWVFMFKLNLLNELRKNDKKRGLPSNLLLVRNELNKFKNTRARLLDSIYHMT